MGMRECLPMVKKEQKNKVIRKIGDEYVAS